MLSIAFLVSFSIRDLWIFLPPPLLAHMPNFDHVESDHWSCLLICLVSHRVKALCKPNILKNYRKSNQVLVK